MKPIRRISIIGLIGIFTLAGVAFASVPLQTQISSTGSAAYATLPASLQTQTISAGGDSVVTIAAQSQGLQLMDPAALPPYATYWVALPGGLTAPLPMCPGTNYPTYAITDNIFLVDQSGNALTVRCPAGTPPTSAMASAAADAQGNAVLNLIAQVQTVAAAQQMRSLARAMGMDDSGPPTPSGGAGGGGDTTFSSSFVLDTNGLYLDITSVLNGLANLNLHNATNQVYALWCATNLATPMTGWQVQTEIWPAPGTPDTNCIAFNVPAFDGTSVFWRAQDWTGVDSDGDGIPDWWAWKYWGVPNVTDTNLDYSGNGNTFAQDFSNNVPPTVFQFTGIETASQFINASSATLQLDVAGTPYYLATLIDDTNFADAVWNLYSGATVTVNLGITEGWHDIWIGLCGHADAATNAVWQWQRMKVDFTAPVLTITGPTNNPVNVPLIQLTGYSSEALSSISYDLSNAAGTVTNQLVLIEDQVYDTNTWEFTTSSFQGYDILLTNGVNTLTLHATDLAGNPATLTTNITFSASTNLATVTLLWPQDGMQMSGSSFTVKGQASDPTASVSVSTVDGAGNANLVSGLIGRDGIIWVQNVPLGTGTNSVTLTVSTANGDTVTVFNVIQSSVGLAIDTVQAGDSTVYGTMDTPGYTIWVNGAPAEQDSGTWTAQITPLGIGGGLVQVIAVPNTENGGALTNPVSPASVSADEAVAAPQGVFVSIYHRHDQTDYQLWLEDYVTYYNVTAYDNLDWQNGTGGQSYQFNYDAEGPWYPLETDDVWPATSWPQALPSGIQTNISWNYDPDYPHPPEYLCESQTGTPVLAQEHCDIYRNLSSTSTERRTADTEMQLATGGPLGSKQMNLWCITASATAYTNLTDTTGTPVPPEQIQIGVFGNLDTNSQLWVMLPDNDPPDITPTLPGKKYFSFTLKGTKYNLTIIANGNGNSFDLSSNVPSFCVGQQIIFTPAWNPGLPTNVLQSSMQWAFNGTFKNDTTNAVPGGGEPTNSNVPFVNTNLLANQTATNYWVSGGANPAPTNWAQFTETLTPPRGKSVNASVYGEFTMFRPQLAVTTKTGVISLDSNCLVFSNGVQITNLFGLHYGIQSVNGSYSSNGMPGIVFTYSNTIPATNGFRGDLEWVQVINNLDSRLQSTNGSWIITGLVTNAMLDNVFPYSETNPAEDDPFQATTDPSEYEGVSCSGSFSMWLLFRPKPQGYLVPLQRVDWGWIGIATSGAGLIYTNNTINPTGIDTLAYPYWTGISTNH